MPRPKTFQQELDAFMGGIQAEESSGDPNAVSGHGARGLWQIMPNNWDAWSRETFGRVVPMTPENQREVTRRKMTEYFDKFGSWDAVAVAWFAGPADAKRYVNGQDWVLNESDGGETVSKYISDALNRLGKTLGYLPESARRSRGTDFYTSPFGDEPSATPLVDAPEGVAAPVPPLRVADPTAATDNIAAQMLGQPQLPTRLQADRLSVLSALGVGGGVPAPAVVPGIPVEPLQPGTDHSKTSGKVPTGAPAGMPAVTPGMQEAVGSPMGLDILAQLGGAMDDPKWPTSGDARKAANKPPNQGFKTRRAGIQKAV